MQSEVCYIWLIFEVSSCSFSFVFKIDAFRSRTQNIFQKKTTHIESFNISPNYYWSVSWKDFKVSKGRPSRVSVYSLWYKAITSDT